MSELTPGGIYRDSVTQEWVVSDPAGWGRYWTLDKGYTLAEIQVFRDRKAGEHRQLEDEELAKSRAMLRLTRVDEDVPVSVVEPPKPPPVIAAPQSNLIPSVKRSRRWGRK